MNYWVNALKLMESVFGGAGEEVWDHMYWKMKDYTYDLASKQQPSVSVSVLQAPDGHRTL